MVPTYNMTKGSELDHTYMIRSKAHAYISPRTHHVLGRMVLCNPSHKALTYTVIPLAVSTLSNTVHIAILVFLSNADTRYNAVFVRWFAPALYRATYRIENFEVESELG